MAPSINCPKTSRVCQIRFLPTVSVHPLQPTPNILPLRSITTSHPYNQSQAPPSLRVGTQTGISSRISYWYVGIMRALGRLVHNITLCLRTVVSLECFYVPANNTGSILDTGTIGYGTDTGIAGPCRARRFRRHYNGSRHYFNRHYRRTPLYMCIVLFP